MYYLNYPICVNKVFSSWENNWDEMFQDSSIWRDFEQDYVPSYEECKEMFNSFIYFRYCLCP